MKLLSSLLVPLLWQTATCSAASAAEDAGDEPKIPSLAINIKTTFPASEIFGTKLVNGQPTKALIAINNHEKEPLIVQMIGGALWTADSLQPTQIVRNLTTQRFNVDIPAGEQQTLTYTFATELQPQDLRLSLVAIIKDATGTAYTAQAFNETVAIVEPDTSIFDPQIIFLYLLLASLFVGTVYFIYSTWITTFFPQTKKPRSKPERTKSAPQVDSPAVAARTTAYDESWLPEGHLKRPEQKRSKSGTPKKVAK